MKPSIGRIMPNESQIINITLHPKLFEKGTQNFNDKFLLMIAT